MRFLIKKDYGGNLKMRVNKKGQGTGGLGSLLVGGITFVVIAVSLIIGLRILDKFDNDFTANSLEANASRDARTGISRMTEQLPNIALVVVLVVIVGLMVGVFLYFRGSF